MVYVCPTSLYLSLDILQRHVASPQLHFVPKQCYMLLMGITQEVFSPDNGPVSICLLSGFNRKSAEFVGLLEKLLVWRPYWTHTLSSPIFLTSTNWSQDSQYLYYTVKMT